MGDKGKFELENRNEDPINYASSVSDWGFGGANLTNTSIGLVPKVNPMAVSKGGLIGSSSCSSTSMVDAFGPTIWDHHANSENLGFCDNGVQKNASTSDTFGIRKGDPVALRSIDKTFDMVWNPTSSMLKGDIFLPNSHAMLPQRLTPFPADSAFIERAARFSCFNGGNFSDMFNPFAVPESMGLYSGAGGVMQGTQEAFAGSGLKSVSGGQSQKNEPSVGEVSKDVSLSVEHGAAGGSPPKDERSQSHVRSHEESKQRSGGSGNDSDEAELSGAGDQDEPSVLEGAGREPFARGLDSRKRKRNGQDAKLDPAKGAARQSGDCAKDNTEIQQTGDQNPTSTTNRSSGKHGKQGSQASDPPKEEYIHVRARRGQATNSHSLAERVRREKISERMKFLQDLVPGCSKVTGKAVMLDEIINYVQSLQRQVEFLSMKLATVNPRLDFNVEGLLAKDILPSRVATSSTLGFSPDMPMAYPPLHPSQRGLIQAGLPGMGSSSDLLQRTIHSQLTPMAGGFKEPTQLPNVWDDELHNVIQMSYGTSAPSNTQDEDGSLPSGQMKVEL
ncbi:hypothetical protein I3843_05G109700 [Carya illinoinensis]|nr:hypothetical protein I3760_05G121500 [Carya illinoinensis]KAG7979025.1 hypothetical protein I3843_05G109700 [Carya illinoinensis]